MGTAEDLAFRKANPRLDDAPRQEEVARARNAIAGGLAVGGDAISRLLSHSGVPTIVCRVRLFSRVNLTSCTSRRMLSQNGCHLQASISSPLW